MTLFRNSGAKQAGLKEDYVERLSTISTYEAPPGKCFTYYYFITYRESSLS